MSVMCNSSLNYLFYQEGYYEIRYSFFGTRYGINAFQLFRQQHAH